MKEPEIAYSKCLLCIKRGSAAEKNVIFFPDYSICLCEEHFQQMMKDYLGVLPVFDKEGEEA